MKNRNLPLLIAILQIVPLAHIQAATPTPNPARRKAIGEVIKSCGLPYKAGKPPFEYIYKETKAVYSRHAMLRDGITGDRMEFPSVVEQQTEPDPALISRYAAQLSFQTRVKAAERLLKVLWIIHDPVGDGNLQSLANSLAGKVAATLCNSSGCDRATREKLLWDLEAIADQFVLNGWRPRGASRIAEEMNTNIEGLNAILANPNSPLDLNYLDYVNHYSALSDFDGGPLMVMPAVKNVMGPLRLEADVKCDKKSNCHIEPHPTNLKGHHVRTAAREMQQMLMWQWIHPVKYTDYDSDPIKNQIIDFYRFAPLSVMAVHEKNPEFDGLLCPFLQLSEAAFGHEKAMDSAKGTALLFSGRVGFWLTSGFVGFFGTSAMLLGGATLGPFALLTIATTIMTGLSAVELYHRMDLIARKGAELVQLRQGVVGGQAKADRAHLIGYLEQVRNREIGTSQFIFVYEAASLVASLGLAKLLVRMIPKNYSSPEQIGRLIIRASGNKGAKKILFKRFGTTDYVRISNLWPSLAPTLQAQIILEMRAELYFAQFVYIPYFLKEMYDAWVLYPNILDFPGNGAISCGPDKLLFRDARCHAYCESSSNPQEAHRCRDL